MKYDNLARRELRSLMFHLLYAIESYEYQISLDSILDDFNRGFELDIPLDSEAVKVVKSVADSRLQLNVIIQQFLSNWRLDRLGVCTRLILYLSVWEMLNTDTPPTIIINEAIELAKCFSEADAYKFINGILDEIAKKLPEIKSQNPS